MTCTELIEKLQRISEVYNDPEITCSINGSWSLQTVAEDVRVAHSFEGDRRAVIIFYE
jgi:hypothetical protein